MQIIAFPPWNAIYVDIFNILLSKRKIQFNCTSLKISKKLKKIFNFDPLLISTKKKKKKNLPTMQIVFLKEPS